MIREKSSGIIYQAADGESSVELSLRCVEDDKLTLSFSNNASAKSDAGYALDIHIGMLKARAFSAEIISGSYILQSEESIRQSEGNYRLTPYPIYAFEDRAKRLTLSPLVEDEKPWVLAGFYNGSKVSVRLNDMELFELATAIDVVVKIWMLVKYVPYVKISCEGP